MQHVFKRLRHGILRLVVAAALAAAGAEAARAAPLDDAFAAYGRKEYAAAMALARPLADAGDGWAAYLVGRMIDLGQGVIYDDVAALQWYLQAAAKGVPDAQLAAARLYEMGESILQDFPAAWAWAAVAADQGLDEAAKYRDHMRQFLIGQDNDVARANYENWGAYRTTERR